jgi:hypothetical protein
LGKPYAAVKFEVPTQKIAIASIEKVLVGPSAADYFGSAQYFLQSNGDIAKARTYIDKAFELKTNLLLFTFEIIDTSKTR